MLNQVFYDIFTERDSKTYCPVRIFGAIGFFAFLILAYIELIRHCHDFNLIEAATGITMILSAIAAGVTYKFTKESSSST